MRFDRHTLVLLVRPPDAPDLSEEEAAELQDRHLAFRADLRDRGVLVDEQCAEFVEHVREALEFFQRLGYLDQQAGQAQRLGTPARDVRS